MRITTMITVIKRDNSKEPFEESKIKGIAVASGLTEEEASVAAQEIIQAVTDFAQSNGNEITSSKIRDIFLEKLKSVNTYAAGLYEWYEKSK